MSREDPVVHVVDDDASFRTAVARLLTAAGYRVRPYASVSAFMDLGGDQATGCVLVDLCMPGQSGLDLQRALIEAGSPVPLIFVSAFADLPTTVRALRDGAIDFLTKPVEKADLFAAVERALAGGTAAPPAGREGLRNGAPKKGE